MAFPAPSVPPTWGRTPRWQAGKVSAVSMSQRTTHCALWTRKIQMDSPKTACKVVFAFGVQVTMIVGLPVPWGAPQSVSSGLLLPSTIPPPPNSIPGGWGLFLPWRPVPPVAPSGFLCPWSCAARCLPRSDSYAQLGLQHRTPTSTLWSEGQKYIPPMVRHSADSNRGSLCLHSGSRHSAAAFLITAQGPEGSAICLQSYS